MGRAGLAAGTPAQDSFAEETRELSHVVFLQQSKSHGQCYLEIYCGADIPGHLSTWVESMRLSLPSLCAKQTVVYLLCMGPPGTLIVAWDAGTEGSGLGAQEVDTLIGGEKGKQQAKVGQGYCGEPPKTTHCEWARLASRTQGARGRSPERTHFRG